MTTATPLALPARVPERVGGVDVNSITCCDALSLLARLPDNSVDMILTDPPYGHNNNNGDLIHRREAALGQLPSGVSNPRPILNDGVEANDLFRACIKEYKRILKPGCCCCCCCCGGGGADPQFARWSLWLDEVLEFKQMVVWDKGPMGMGWHYRRSYETVLVAMKPGAACKWYDTSKRVENIIRPKPGYNKIIPSKTDHPTVKPIALMADFIRWHTKPGDLVVDPFCGQGTTLEAAQLLGRKFIGVELDPHWAEVARRNISKPRFDMPNGLMFADSELAG